MTPSIGWTVGGVGIGLLLADRILPRMSKMLGPERCKQLEKLSTERGPYGESPKGARLMQLAARSIVFGGRGSRYWQLEEVPLRVKGLAAVCVILELLAVCMLVRGGQLFVEELDLGQFPVGVTTMRDRLAGMVQQLCGPQCPPSTYVQILGYMSLVLIMIHELIPNPRYKWLPREGRYVRRW